MRVVLHPEAVELLLCLLQSLQELQAHWFFFAVQVGFVNQESFGSVHCSHPRFVGYV